METSFIGKIVASLSPHGGMGGGEETLNQCIFALMGVLAAIALVAKIRARRRLAAETTSVSTSFDDIFSGLRSSDARVVEVMPGVLLSIGLLFTFVGVALAIQEAGRSVAGHSADPQETVKHLTATLQVLGLKFRSSVWGLGMSILLRPLAGELERQRADTARRLATEAADAANRRRQETEGALTSTASATASISKTTRKLAAAVDAFRKQEETAAAATAAALNSVASDITGGSSLEQVKKQQAAIDKTLRSFLEQYEREVKHRREFEDKVIAENARQVGDVLGRLVELTEARASARQAFEKSLLDVATKARDATVNLGTRLEGLSQLGKELSSGAETISASVDGLRKAVEGDLRKVLGDAQSAIADSTLQLKAASEGLGGTVKEAMDQFGGELRKTLGTIADELKTATGGISHAVADSSQAMVEAHREGSKILKEGMSSLHSSVTDMSGKMTDGLNGMAKETEFLAKVMPKLTAAVEESRQLGVQNQTALQSMLERFELVVQGLNRTMGDFKTSANDLKKDMSATAGASRASSEILARMESKQSETGQVIAEVATRLTATSEAATRDLQAISAATRSSAGVLTDVAARMGAVSEAVVRELPVISDKARSSAGTLEELTRSAARDWPRAQQLEGLQASIETLVQRSEPRGKRRGAERGIANGVDEPAPAI